MLYCVHCFLPDPSQDTSGYFTPVDEEIGGPVGNGLASNQNQPAVDMSSFLGELKPSPNEDEYVDTDGNLLIRRTLASTARQRRNEVPTDNRFQKSLISLSISNGGTVAVVRKQGKIVAPYGVTLRAFFGNILNFLNIVFFYDS